VRPSTPPRRARAAFAGLAVLVAALLVAAARADDPATLRNAAEELESTNALLASRSRDTLLELYGIQARLGMAERRILTLDAQASAIESERASAQLRLTLALRARREAEQRLGERLRALYREGGVDPLAVLLGSSSLNDAVAAIDSLERVAREDRRISEQVARTSAGLRRALKALEARRSELRAVSANAHAARAALAATRLERTAYLEALSHARQLNTQEITRLLANAAEIEAQSSRLNEAAVATSQPATAAVGWAPRAAGRPNGSGTTLTVRAVAYSLKGRTASGMPVGWGVAAVDPSVIPLGTRMTVPGYGDAIAADTGSAVSGFVIDLWFPSLEQARTWGAHTVTITLH
jgi:cystine transport system substrate-binding protein